MKEIVKLFAIITLICAPVFWVAQCVATPDVQYKYDIYVIGGQTYHTNSFRLYGRSIIFDTDTKRVIVSGDYVILSKLEE
jgi:hypothetical protein